MSQISDGTETTVVRYQFDPQRPRIYNRNYRGYWHGPGPEVLRMHKEGNHRMPWVLEFKNQEYAIGETREHVMEELIRLQWAGRLPTPGVFQ